MLGKNFYFFLLIMIMLSTQIAICSIFWQDDFSSFNPSDYYTSGNGYYNALGGNYVLTQPNLDQHAKLYYATPTLIAVWRAEFNFRIGGGTGADGMTFAFVPDYTYPDTHGGSLDFHNTSGYAIEFDTYYNPEFDPNEHHIAVLYNDFTNHLITANVNVEDNQWHSCTIDFNMGHVTVTIDNVQRLDYVILNYTPFTGYFGFTAATGGATNWHVIDNVVVYDLTTPTPTPTPTVSPTPTISPTPTNTPTPPPLPLFDNQGLAILIIIFLFVLLKSKIKF